MACRLVVVGARRGPGALYLLRETQPVVPHCAGEVRKKKFGLEFVWLPFKPSFP